MTLAYLFGFSDYVVMLSRAIQVDLHEHHAMQIAFGLEHPLKLHCTVGQIVGRGVFVPGDTPHQIDSGATLSVLVHPESPLGLRMMQVFGQDAQPIPDNLMPAIPEDWTTLTCQSIAWMLSELWSACAPLQPTNLDPRIDQALAYIHRMEVVKVTVQEIADAVQLSPSRFMSLFRQETGIALRRYLLWHRLLKAANQIMDGTTFTTAAHTVGFADSSHLAGTFKQMFGMTLCDVFMAESFVRARFCS